MLLPSTDARPLSFPASLPAARSGGARRSCSVMPGGPVRSCSARIPGACPATLSARLLPVHSSTPAEARPQAAARSVPAAESTGCPQIHTSSAQRVHYPVENPHRPWSETSVEIRVPVWTRAQLSGRKLCPQRYPQGCARGHRGRHGSEHAQRMAATSCWGDGRRRAAAEVQTPQTPQSRRRGAAAGDQPWGNRAAAITCAGGATSRAGPRGRPASPAAPGACPSPSCRAPRRSRP